MFSIGDRVRLVRPEDDGYIYIKRGTEGTVVTFSLNDVGVAFDDNVGGHDCQRKCEHGHGWFFLERDLERVDDSSECEIEDEDLLSII